jgi:hypothetical protein
MKNPHALPKGDKFYTFDKDKADAMAASLGTDYTVGRYSPGDTWAVYQKGEGAVPVNWDIMRVSTYKYEPNHRHQLYSKARLTP